MMHPHPDDDGYDIEDKKSRGEEPVVGLGVLEPISDIEDDPVQRGKRNVSDGDWLQLSPLCRSSIIMTRQIDDPHHLTPLHILRRMSLHV